MADDLARELGVPENRLAVLPTLSRESGLVLRPLLFVHALPSGGFRRVKHLLLSVDARREFLFQIE
jgi:hypothetical protein